MLPICISASSATTRISTRSSVWGTSRAADGADFITMRRYALPLTDFLSHNASFSDRLVFTRATYPGAQLLALHRWPRDRID